MRKFLLTVFCGLFMCSSVYLLAGWFYGGFTASTQTQPKPEIVGNSVQIKAKVKAGDSVRKANLKLLPIYAPHTSSDDLLLDLEMPRVSGPAIFSRDLAVGSVLKDSDVLMPDEPGYISHQLKQGFRAKSLLINNFSKYHGLVYQGDAVDILFMSLGGPKGKVARKPNVQTLIRNAKIIGPVPAQFPDETGNSPGPQARSLVFALSLQDALRASLAEEVGKLTIVLRKPGGVEERSVGRSGIPLAALYDLVSSDPLTIDPEVQEKAQLIRVMRGSDLTTISVPGRVFGGAE